VCLFSSLSGHTEIEDTLCKGFLPFCAGPALVKQAKINIA
jgi:hypothetical protein